MSEFYRDRTEGAAAKRQELLRRRRDELVTMPHAVRRVIVARSARIAAGMAITLSGIALLVVASSGKLAGGLANLMPGIQPAPISTIVAGMWIVGVVAWAVSRARVEHRFAVEMSKYVLPGQDLDHDIERLDHERPDEIARQMAHRLEVKSAAWPVIAAAALLPASALYIARGVVNHGWPVMSEYEASLALHSHALIAITAVGAALAIVMTRRAGRLPVVAPIAGALALVAGVLAIGMFAREASTAGWWLAGAAVLACSAAFIANRLRVERVLIAAEDPAAGSELFTLRGFIRSVRNTAGAAMAKVRAMPRGRRIRIIAVGAVLIGGSVFYFRHGKSAAADTSMAQSPNLVVPHALPHSNANPFEVPYTIKHVGSRIAIDIALDGNSLDIPSLGELDTVPYNWHALVSVESGNSDASIAVGLLGADGGPMPGMQTLDINNPRTVLSIDACDEEHAQPLGLHVERVNKSVKGSLHVTLYVVPDLTVASCTPAIK